MNKYETDLLTLSAKHYLETRKNEFKYLMKNGDEVLNFISAGRSLVDNGFIEPISDNFHINSLQIPNDLVLEFKITQQGFLYYMNNLKDED